MQEKHRLAQFPRLFSSSDYTSWCETGGRDGLCRIRLLRIIQNTVQLVLFGKLSEPETLISEKREIASYEFPKPVCRLRDKKQGSEDRRKQKHGKYTEDECHMTTSFWNFPCASAICVIHIPEYTTPNPSLQLLKNGSGRRIAQKG